MKYYEQHEEEEITLIRKCVVFYKLISTEDKVITFDTSVIDKLTKDKIGTDLFPMLRKKEMVDLEAMKKVVREFADNVMVLTPGDKKYIERFMKGEYVPRLLFDDEKIVSRIKNHQFSACVRKQLLRGISLRRFIGSLLAHYYY